MPVLPTPRSTATGAALQATKHRSADLVQARVRSLDLSAGRLWSSTPESIVINARVSSGHADSRRALTRFASVALLAAALPASACPGANDVTTNSLPPARDGNIAIQEELDAARRAGTREAYDLFIARHPRHPLADLARREREELRSRR